MDAAASHQVQDHYASEGIAARILAALRAARDGKTGPITPDALAPLDHFHGRGLKATQEMVALLEPRPGERILDIGGGIGGPARWIAARFGCHVTSLDLTPEFCRAAEELNAATGLSDCVRVVEGSALDLPFAENAFDRAYSENVAMNIEDKRRFACFARGRCSPSPTTARGREASPTTRCPGRRGRRRAFSRRLTRHGSRFLRQALRS